MTTLRRLRLALILAMFSLVPLAGTIIGGVAFWQRESLAFNLITIFLVLMFAFCFGISLSIGLDSGLADIPWAKIGVFFTLLLLSGGVAWVRDMT
ncbi:hypothetical protein FB565_007044 [Actinoplanes lutulentus]|uniref:Uncharacterized protein n=1 Tax=Actinoplanes lutulentus TaxID=1287878 RepID=A0A327ZB69_9ACTN|nr:hypothetical protein [Actinoplanes lutulentus]MBB2947276.1 hypothetical protein [Actinoplanes lutulentus]RAK36551.1 hypothetical protein B0I29_108141 [Actinoplanes lutulentus]